MKRKLILKRETIRALAVADLARAHGGLPDDSNVDIECAPTQRGSCNVSCYPEECLPHTMRPNDSFCGPWPPP